MHMQLLVHKAADTDTDTDTDMYIVDVGVVNNRTWLAICHTISLFYLLDIFAPVPALCVVYLLFIMLN